MQQLMQQQQLAVMSILQDELAQRDAEIARISAQLLTAKEQVAQLQQQQQQQQRGIEYSCTNSASLVAVAAAAHGGDIVRSEPPEGAEHLHSSNTQLSVLHQQLTLRHSSSTGSSNSNSGNGHGGQGALARESERREKLQSELIATLKMGGVMPMHVKSKQAELRVVEQLCTYNIRSQLESVAVSMSSIEDLEEAVAAAAQCEADYAVMLRCQAGSGCSSNNSGGLVVLAADYAYYCYDNIDDGGDDDDDDDCAHSAANSSTDSDSAAVMMSGSRCQRDRQTEIQSTSSSCSSSSSAAVSRSKYR